MIHMRRNRRAIDVYRPPIVIVESSARHTMRAPVRMLDGRRVVMIVIAVFHQVDVRRRQHRREHSRGGEQRGSNRPAETGGNHLVNITVEA
jgi:chloramphenicol 3-O-phosphotransferase